jgi:subtilisin family serine protease
MPAKSYGLKSGTSMATPGVVAVVALLKAKCPIYTPAQIQNRLTSTAQVLGASNTFGAGLVRAESAPPQVPGTGGTAP